MKAGFARARITPPAGTPMTGFGGRDRDHGCEGVHDDLYARALYLEHGGERALIMAFDICFFAREDADRCKGAVGRRVDLAPRQILLNSSHTHCGPAVGRWSYNGFDAPPDPLYLDDLMNAAADAAARAVASAREATLAAGTGRSTLPMSRRKPDGKGGVEWRPYAEGTICDALPVCLFTDTAAQPICLLFSLSCHPSTTGGWEISADYPGVATAQLDEHLGAACSLFLQGAGGDTKARVIGNGRDDVDVCWRRGTWDDVKEAGTIVAQEVLSVIERGLKSVEPGLRAVELEMNWPLQALPDRAGFEAFCSSPDELRRLWAQKMIRRLDRGERLAAFAPIIAHGMQLGRGARLIGIEGELVAGLGSLILGLYGGGVTFPMGYTDGAQLYLPTSGMVDEGGYEVDSYYEYGFPARLAKGMEEILTLAIEDLRTRGIG